MSNEQWACLHILGSDCSSGASQVIDFWCLIMEEAQWWRRGQNLYFHKDWGWRLSLEISGIDLKWTVLPLLKRNASGHFHSCKLIGEEEKKYGQVDFYLPTYHIVTVLFWFILFIAIVSRCSRRVGRQAGGSSSRVKDALLHANYRGI